MINTVIFDMDGLMFDTETLYIDVFEDVCKKQGHAFPREYFLGMLGTSHFDYSIYRKEYPWLEDMLEIADDVLDYVCNKSVHKTNIKTVDTLLNGMYARIKEQHDNPEKFGLHIV